MLRELTQIILHPSLLNRYMRFTKNKYELIKKKLTTTDKEKHIPKERFNQFSYILSHQKEGKLRNKMSDRIISSSILYAQVISFFNRKKNSHPVGKI